MSSTVSTLPPGSYSVVIKNIWWDFYAKVGYDIPRSFNTILYLGPNWEIINNHDVAKMIIMTENIRSSLNGGIIITDMTGAQSHIVDGENARFDDLEVTTTIRVDFPPNNPARIGSMFFTIVFMRDGILSRKRIMPYPSTDETYHDEREKPERAKHERLEYD